MSFPYPQNSAMWLYSRADFCSQCDARGFHVNTDAGEIVHRGRVMLTLRDPIHGLLEGSKLLSGEGQE